MATTKNDVLGEAGVHLWLVLWKATKEVERLARRSVRATGLCLSDFGVLEALLHKGPLPVSALQKKVLLSSGSMTAAVDRLELRGWVERTFDPTDRRARIVRLTRAGSKLIRKLFREHARDLENAFSALDRPEKEALADLLRKFGHSVGRQAVGESNTGRKKQGSLGRS